MGSNDTQICLQSDAVRFTIMNSGESYIVKMYEWYNRDWVLALTFRNCEVEADSYDGFVSIRAEKSSQSRELDRLPNGVFAEFLEYDGEWYKINYESITGYVYGKFAKKRTMINP